MANPTLLTSPIAENGDKNVIPATTGATTGLLDQEHGFQQINELPLQAGGLPPQRKDFNGAFNLLSKILFYAQKGYVFEFDENQDYYAGCITKDTDGGLYCANTDVPNSSTHPKDDPTNWSLVNYGINKKETFTSSGSFTAPVTGTYRITLQGGGGGGAGCSSYTSGNGGGAGGKIVFYEKLTQGQAYPYVIGAGGTGGGIDNSGGQGGASSITINGRAYVCNGGGGANFSNDISQGSAGNGGAVKIDDVIFDYGEHGEVGYVKTGIVSNLRGGHGGAMGLASHSSPIDGINGAGGQGGSLYGGAKYVGTAGGDGYIAFEYCDI